MRSKTLICLSLCLSALLMVWGCGGSGTYSPTVSGGGSVVVAQGVTISITPATTSTFPTGSVQFQAIVKGTSNTAVTWSVLTEGAGTITSAGLFTAENDDFAVAGKKAKTRGSSQVVIQAVSVADPTKSATATITVSDLQVNITPANPTVVAGGTIQFSATVTGATNNQGVTWAADDGGSVSSTGLFTAPLKPGGYQILAFSNAQNGAEGFTDITVVAPPNVSVSVSPSSQAVAIGGGTTTFKATVTGTTDQTVTWSLVPTSQGVVYGSIDPNTGVYTSPQSVVGNFPTFKIQATSQIDPTKSGTATINLYSS